MSENSKLGFDLERKSILLTDILPVRTIKNPQAYTSRYTSIMSSIKDVGLVEPLVVYPEKKLPGKYLLLDGHLRYFALGQLGMKKAECIISTDDESFTYNARISRLSPMQEHAMITKAVKSGVSPERLASALNRSVGEIRANLNLLDGIEPEAIEILKTKRMSVHSIRVLKRVVPFRQIEIAELMAAANNFSAPYAQALLVGTPKDMLRHAERDKERVSPEDLARMESELENIERDFKNLEESYHEKVLNLTLAKGYVKKLIENAKVVRFLTSKYADILTEFEALSAMDSI